MQRDKDEEKFEKKSHIDLEGIYYLHVSWPNTILMLEITTGTDFSEEFSHYN